MLGKSHPLSPDGSIRNRNKRPQRLAIPRIVPLLVVWHCCPHLAGAVDDAPPVDPVSAMADLAKLEQTREKALEAQRGEALSAVRRAAATGAAAARFYEEAVEEGVQQDFADWKKKNADLLRDKTFQTAAQLHLHYLMLSLEHGPSGEADRWAEPSLLYARELAVFLADDDFRQAPGPTRQLLGKPLTESPFVRWMQLGPLLPPADAWEQVPGNLGGILEKNVRRPWRQTCDARLERAWQLELETAAALATADGTDRAAEEFNNRTAPLLQFRRARDRAATGQPNRAAADILNLARKHPDHPDFPQWAATLREMLEKKTQAP